ncbi:hypothetical protein DL96DRAFT_1614775 [Flagelloscypha sp. PMI_526]|nr:hypothetical protein DL96DRAFT_1614775 [Flagelloscypha sp. PMI_526]
MQLGSLGATGLQAARHALHRGNIARNFHVSALHARPGAGRQFLQESRHFLAKFFSHLTAPGIGHQSYPSFNHVVRRSVTNHSALPLRTLGRQTFLPRAPAIPRSVTQVGLGTARQFSSARPIFQNLVQNTPVAARAFCEADIDVKSSKKAHKKSSKAKKAAKGKKVSYKVKDLKVPALLSDSTSRASEMDVYFHVPISSVTTSLHIPLAPTPTERTPLRERPVRGEGSFLPLSSLASIHITHEMHTTRVASLFSRLDAANVWGKGVTCSAYSHLARGQGVATILKVEFVGWSKAEVRAVIGESGTGWCALEEHRSTESRDSVIIDGPGSGYDSDASDTSSMLSGIMGDESCFSEVESVPSTPPIDPSGSFVLPTLDFSSSFIESIQSTPPTPPMSDFDYFSDSSEGSSLVEIRPAMEFSAEFLNMNARSRLDAGPMEAMF